MTDKEEVVSIPTEKKTERVFVLGIGKGPKMRTIRFVVAPKEECIKTEGSVAEEPKEEKEDPKQDS